MTTIVLYSYCLSFIIASTTNTHKSDILPVYITIINTNRTVVLATESYNYRIIMWI